MLIKHSAFDAMQARLKIAAELYGLEETLFKVFIQPLRLRPRPKRLPAPRKMKPPRH